MLDHCDGAREHHVDLSTDDVGQRRAVALVGNVGEAHAGGLRKELAQEVRGVAVARARVGELAGLHLGEADHVGRRLHLELGIGDEHVGGSNNASDRLEVAGRVVRRLRHEKRGVYLIGRTAHEDRVSVRLGVPDLAGTDRAAGPSLILDDHGLPELACHALADGSGKDVGRPARRERDDQSDEFGGVGFGGERGTGN